jgi:integration host factor subunit alpha
MPSRSHLRLSLIIQVTISHLAITTANTRMIPIRILLRGTIRTLHNKTTKSCSSGSRNTKLEIGNISKTAGLLIHPKTDANRSPAIFQSFRILESVLETVKTTLSNGDDVLISGFEKFSVKKKGPRRGRNPATGGDLILDARTVVTFRCSGVLRDKINGESHMVI